MVRNASSVVILHLALAVERWDHIWVPHLTGTLGNYQVDSLPCLCLLPYIVGGSQHSGICLLVCLCLTLEEERHWILFTSDIQQVESQYKKSN